jgi:hypothetical protein
VGSHAKCNTQVRRALRVRKTEVCAPTTPAVEPSQFLAEAASFFIGGAEAFRPLFKLVDFARDLQTEGEANLTAIR